MKVHHSRLPGSLLSGKEARDCLIIEELVSGSGRAQLTVICNYVNIQGGKMEMYTGNLVDKTD